MEKTAKMIIKKLELGERIVTSMIFCSMLIVVTAQIVMRYLFGHPILWSEEFARYVYVWLVFLGSAYGITQEKHVAVTLLIDRLPKTARNVLKVICNLCILVALGYMLPHSIEYLGKQSGLRSGCMQIPMSWVFAAVPIGYSLIIIHIVLQTIVLLSSKNRKEGVPL